MLHPTLNTPHLTLYPFHSTLCTQHFKRYTQHSTLSTLHSTPYTLHFTLYTLHPTLHIPHSTLHTWQFTLHTSHFLIHTLHFTLHTSHFALPFSSPTTMMPGFVILRVGIRVRGFHFVFPFFPSVKTPQNPRNKVCLFCLGVIICYHSITKVTSLTYDEHFGPLILP